MKKNYLILLALCAASFGYAQIAAYSGTNTPTANAVTNATATPLSRGAGLNTEGGTTFNSSSWQTGALNTTNNDYIEWSITADTGYIINISSLEINYDRDEVFFDFFGSRSGGSGPSDVVLRSSLDNFSTNLFTDNNVNINGETNTITTNLSSTTGGVITFRLYGFNAVTGFFSTNNGTFDIEGGLGNILSIANTGIRINGSVDQVPCPEITNLTVDSITSSSANISWIAGASETDWEIAVQTAGTGEPVGAGTPVATNSFTANTLSVSTAYEVYVRADCDIDGFSNWVGPINFMTPIANDNFANATPISCGNIYIGDTTLATIDEVGAPNVSTIESNTNADNDSPNVWFRFIGTGDPITLSTCANTSFDTEIIVFTGTSGNLTNVAEGYDECSNATYEAEVTFNSVLGTVYSISVEGWNVGDTGTFELSVICTPPAPVTYTYNGLWTPSNPIGTATSGDDIIIASGDATINSNTTVNSVTVNAGAGLIVDAGVILTTSNGLALKSNSTSYSSLILDGTVTGTLTYDRHVNVNGSGITGSNDLISAPLTGQTFDDFATANPNIFNNGTLYLFGPFDKTVANYLIYTGTETASLDAGVGYRAASSDNDTFTFTGTANSETVSIDITNYGTYEAEWNLVGNPYPSYLNVQAFLNHSVSPGVSNLALFDAGTAAIYGYDGNALDDWTIYNLANTTASTVIAPGQGFFVSANVTNVPLYNLEFTPAMRSTGTGDDFIVGRNAELVYIKLNASTSNNSYHTDFYFNNNSSLGFDLGYDAKIWGDITPDFAIYSHLAQDNNGTPITLQSLPVSNLTDVSIPLGVNANQGEQLTFSIADMTLPASINVYLDDVVANTSTLLNNSDYIITPTTTLSGTGRFFLRTSEDALSTIENNLDTLNIFALNMSKELIVNGQLKDNTILNLYDIQGRNVLSTQLDHTNLKNRIDVSALSSGVYVVNIKNNEQNKSQKVIFK